MSRFLSDKYRLLRPYVPGEQPRDFKYIKLNTNESPYPPSPRVISALSGEEAALLRLYSDPEAKALKSAVAARFGVSEREVFVGNGSDEVLAFCFSAFCGEREICYPDITYGFYEIFCGLYGLKVNKVPLKDDFTVEPEDYADCGKNIVIANPNAPTGLALKVKEVEKIAASNPDGVVIIDEAYVDFGAESCVELTKRYDNLIVVQTFSKSRQLAGGRVGFALANEQLIADLELMKYSFNPYNVNRLSQIAAKAAIEDEEYFGECRSKIIEARDYASGRLKEAGFELTDSKANFLFCKKEGFSGGKLYSELKARGILVRHFDKPRIDDYVRVTVGSMRDMETFVNAAKQITGR